MATNIFILKTIVFVILIHFCQGKAFDLFHKYPNRLCKVRANKLV